MELIFEDIIINEFIIPKDVCPICKGKKHEVSSICLKCFREFQKEVKQQIRPTNNRSIRKKNNLPPNVQVHHLAKSYDSDTTGLDSGEHREYHAKIDPEILKQVLHDAQENNIDLSIKDLVERFLELYNEVSINTQVLSNQDSNPIKILSK